METTSKETTPNQQRQKETEEKVKEIRQASVMS
jgi:hypothetical protein